MPTESKIPAITTQQMVEVDRLMVEDYGIGLIQMMENAGRSLAELTRRRLGGDVSGRNIAVLCGAGNNGGGGMVAARHVHNWGAEVAVKAVFKPEKMKDIPAHQWDILQKIGIPDLKTEQVSHAEIILDAIIGYGLSGDPYGLAAEWIEIANRSRIPILALDAPSGLYTTTGIPGDPCISATATLTLALPKTGLLEPAARPVVGDLYLADISVPAELYRQIGILIPPIFSQDHIIRIT
ncbi:MAG: NAD(P)H-hydrate epimerase [Anaerolineales bacterium]